MDRKQQFSSLLSNVQESAFHRQYFPRRDAACGSITTPESPLLSSDCHASAETGTEFIPSLISHLLDIVMETGTSIQVEKSVTLSAFTWNKG